MSASPNTVLSFHETSYRYPGRAGTTWAVEGLSFAIGAGEHVALVGGNGSGKSTLAKLSCGLLVPDEGTVRVCGRDAADEAQTQAIHACCGYVFQNPDDQLVESAVEDEVAFGPANLGLPRAEIAERVRQALDATGLAAYASRQVSTLSGGQKQRVAIAGVLALRPALIVLDEADSMLDPQSRHALQRVLAHLREQGVTTLSITHFMDTALQADRVIALEKGRLAFEGTPEQMFSDEALLERLSLAAPFPVRMRNLLSEQGCAVPFCRSNAQLARAIAAIQTAPDGAEMLNSGIGYTEMDGKLRPKGAAGPSDGEARKPETADGTPTIVFERVSCSYTAVPPKRRRTRKPAPTPDLANAAVSDLSFQVSAGSLIGIAGATGSGKSTVLKLLAGLISPTLGRISCTQPDGTPAYAGLSFQYPERQLFASTVIEDVAFGPKNQGRSTAEAYDDAAWALGCVRIPESLWERSPFSLSGGEQRRAALAGTLAMRPDILALDEPTAGQDPAAREALVGLIERLQSEGTTVVLASHDLELLERCDRLLVMDGGRPVMSGTPSEIFAQTDDLVRLGLEPPPLPGLIAALREQGFATLPCKTPEELACALTPLHIHGQNRTDGLRGDSDGHPRTK